MDKKKLIYISGYGRSGSTILEIVLSKNFNVFPTGETSNLFEFYIQDGICECGKHLPNCLFWDKILSKENKKNVDRLNSITKRAQSPLIGKIYESKWKKIWNPIIDKLFRYADSNIIIDSSKSTRGTFNRKILLENTGISLNEVLLIRNPVDVMKSVKKGSNKNLEKNKENPVLFGGAIRAGVSWFITNFFAISRFDDSNGIILTYENFVRDTENAMKKIEREFNLEKNENKYITHGISGNRLRRNTGKIEIKKRTNNTELNFFEKGLSSILLRYYSLLIT
jgi:hypothetical protein